jgi:hypothetical protein
MPRCASSGLHRGQPWPSVTDPKKRLALNPHLEYHLTDTLFRQFSFPIQTFGPTEALVSSKTAGFLKCRAVVACSLIVAQCSEQLGCEIRADGTLNLSGTDRRFPLLIRHEDKNMCADYGGRLTRSDRRTLNRWQNHTSLLQEISSTDDVGNSRKVKSGSALRDKRASTCSARRRTAVLWIFPLLFQLFRLP